VLYIEELKVEVSDVELLTTTSVEVPPCIIAHQGMTAASTKPFLVVTSVALGSARVLSLTKGELEGIATKGKLGLVVLGTKE
jgi:hypothetical protein